jgi:hypothetical protein
VPPVAAGQDATQVQGRRYPLGEGCKASGITLTGSGAHRCDDVALFSGVHVVAAEREPDELSQARRPGVHSSTRTAAGARGRNAMRLPGPGENVDLGGFCPPLCAMIVSAAPSPRSWRTSSFFPSRAFGRVPNPCASAVLPQPLALTPEMSSKPD